VLREEQEPDDPEEGRGRVGLGGPEHRQEHVGPRPPGHPGRLHAREGQGPLEGAAVQGLPEHPLERPARVPEPRLQEVRDRGGPQLEPRVEVAKVPLEGRVEVPVGKGPPEDGHDARAQGDEPGRLGQVRPSRPAAGGQEEGADVPGGLPRHPGQHPRQPRRHERRPEEGQHPVVLGEELARVDAEDALQGGRGGGGGRGQGAPRGGCWGGAPRGGRGGALTEVQGSAAIWKETRSSLAPKKVCRSSGPFRKVVGLPRSVTVKVSP